MSLVLALETATEQFSVAVGENDLLLCEVTVHHGRDLSRLLMSAVRNCMDLAQRPLAGVDAIACSVGPGSFTGLRIGVTAAKTLAYALNVPTIAISSLEVLAASVPTYRNELILAAIDARRDEYFAAVFVRSGGRLERRTPDSLVAAADLESFARAAGKPKADSGWEPQDPPFLIVTTPASAERLQERMDVSARAVGIPTFPRASAAALLGREALDRGEIVQPVDLTPAYLRRSYAEEKAQGGAR